MGFSFGKNLRFYPVFFDSLDIFFIILYPKNALFYEIHFMTSAIKWMGFFLFFRAPPRSLTLLPLGRGFHAEHREGLVHLVEPDGFLALLELAHEPEPKARTHREFLLGQSRFFPFLFDKGSNGVHKDNLHPFGYKTRNITKKCTR